MFGFGARVTRINTENVRALSAGGDGILALPIRQGAPAWVGGNEIHQMRGARTRHPDDDDWLFDRDGFDLGIPLNELGK